MIRIQAQDEHGSVHRRDDRCVEAALAERRAGHQVHLGRSVGPKVSGELIQTAFLAVAGDRRGACLYLAAVRMAVRLGAVVALVHDVVLTIGVFSHLQIRFDLAIIAALLTIVGYSLNDTVVVFDRVRENLRKYKKRPLREVLNLSINETLSRTLMTSVTTLLALIALYCPGRRRDPGLCLRDDLGRDRGHLFVDLRRLDGPAVSGRQARLVQTGRQARQPIRKY